MSSLITQSQRNDGLPAIVDPVDAEHMLGAEPQDAGLESHLAAERMQSIHADLAQGEIDRAYATFTDWIRQEARYAKADRQTNMRELVASMLEMIGWMYGRVPRSMVKSAAGAR